MEMSAKFPFANVEKLLENVVNGVELMLGSSDNPEDHIPTHDSPPNSCQRCGGKSFTKDEENSGSNFWGRTTIWRCDSCGTDHVAR
jgi:hypothetical protein